MRLAKNCTSVIFTRGKSSQHVSNAWAIVVQAQMCRNVFVLSRDYDVDAAAEEVNSCTYYVNWFISFLLTSADSVRIAHGLKRNLE